MKNYRAVYLQMKHFFRENDFSVYTDPETGEIVCKVIPKDMDAERKKAERAAQLTALADLMESNGYTIDELKELMSMPKPTVEVAMRNSNNKSPVVRVDRWALLYSLI